LAVRKERERGSNGLSAGSVLGQNAISEPPNAFARKKGYLETEASVREIGRREGEKKKAGVKHGSAGRPLTSHFIIRDVVSVTYVFLLVSGLIPA
jgi:hypothetical protein